MLKLVGAIIETAPMQRGRVRPVLQRCVTAFLRALLLAMSLKAAALHEMFLAFPNRTSALSISRDKQITEAAKCESLHSAAEAFRPAG